MRSIDGFKGADGLVGLLLCLLDLVERETVMRPEFYDAERLKEDFGAKAVHVEARTNPF